MKTIIVLIISLLFLNGYSQKTHDKKNASEDWKAIKIAMLDLQKNYKKAPTKSLIYDDSLLRKASKLFEAFCENYPKDKRCKKDYKVFPSSLGGIYVLPHIAMAKKRASLNPFKKSFYP